MKDKHSEAVRRLSCLRLAVAAVFLIAVVVIVIVFSGELDIYLPEGSRAADYVPEKGIVRVISDPKNERHMTVSAIGRGREFINNKGDRGGFEYVSVLPGGIVFDKLNGNFSGWKQIVSVTELFLIINTLLVLASFVMRCRKEMFSYSTLFSGGITLLWVSTTVGLLIHLLTVGSEDAIFSMMYIYSLIKDAGGVFMTLSIPVMAVMVLALTVSTISLIRREGKSFVNLLGLILSGFIIAGYAFGILCMGNLYAYGSEQEMRVFNTVTSLYDTVFVYFQAMLLSASICGIIAVLKKPAYDKTHAIILGCAIAADGTPLPLLKGRIDRAVSFARAQEAAGGGSLIFVPSGGKGADEVISEAESMKAYLVSQGISESRILLEDRSTTTQENMRFSLEKIKAGCDDPRIVFSTSGYHVLRSGIISRNEGLEADGIGSRTKWYFFPNAFVREFIGLLVSKWKQHILLIVLFALFFAAVNMILPM